MKSNMQNNVVIIDGCRTPFLKSGTGFADAMAWELGRYAVKGLIGKTGIAAKEIDHGNVWQWIQKRLRCALA